VLFLDFELFGYPPKPPEVFPSKENGGQKLLDDLQNTPFSYFSLDDDQKFTTTTRAGNGN
jgi:hypothetical protein